MKKLVKLAADGTVSVHDYPEGGYRETHPVLTLLIGSSCGTIEHVRPRYLYTDWGGVIKAVDPYETEGMVSMLIDEEGMYHDLPVNNVASLLYGFFDHGHPIVGNVLFVGEVLVGGDLNFCGIDDEQVEVLTDFLKTISSHFRKVG